MRYKVLTDSDKRIYISNISGKKAAKAVFTVAAAAFLAAWLNRKKA